MNKPWLTCAQFAALSEQRLASALTPAQRLAMWLHLHICGPCAAHQDQLDQTVSLLHDLQHDAPAPVPADKKKALIAAFRQAKQP